MHKTIASIFAVIIGFMAHPAHAQDPAASTPLDRLPIQRETLPNGLRVVLSQDRAVPIVAIAVYYDVGSRNEVQGRSGFAHLFEHMMFQGSDNVAKGQHFSLIMNRGGSMNGTTNADRTNYYETLPSNDLALGLWLEADRMRSLAVTEENFENQRQVVMEERRSSYDNQPYVPSMLRMNELTYGDYWPYAHSTIGHMEDLVNAPLAQVQAFWRSHYAPNNAVLAIAGDFDPEEAMSLVRKHFGEIERRETPSYSPPAFVPQSQEKTESVTDRLAELPAFHVGWHIPENREPDHYALELLANVLGDGESSRFYQKLVKEREILQEISVATDDARGPDLFSMFAIVSPGHTGQEARQVIFETIDGVAAQGIEARELEKAKNRISASFVFGLQSNMARAQALGEFELFWGNAELLKGELARYQAVTLEDIQRVARTYLIQFNRTVLDVLTANEIANDTAEDSAASEGGAQ